jgi:hypothetical protein
MSVQPAAPPLAGKAGGFDVAGLNAELSRQAGLFAQLESGIAVASVAGGEARWERVRLGCCGLCRAASCRDTSAPCVT